MCIFWGVYVCIFQDELANLDGFYTAWKTHNETAVCVLDNAITFRSKSWYITIDSVLQIHLKRQTNIQFITVVYVSCWASLLCFLQCFRVTLQKSVCD